MLHLILLIAAGILVLSFFGISLQSLVHSPVAQANLAYAWQLAVTGWNLLVSYIQTLIQQNPFQASIANFSFIR